MHNAKLLTIFDRAGGREMPLARVLVQREERRPQGGIPADVILALRYWVIGLSSRFPAGEFIASYCAAQGVVSLVSGLSHGSGAVFIDPAYLRGHRLGTYLMNEVVAWAQQWPGALVAPVQLLAPEANDEGAKLRRNRFYERFGLTFDYEDKSCRSGVSRPITVRQLMPVTSWKKNVEELKLLDALARHGDVIDDMQRQIESKNGILKK